MRAQSERVQEHAYERRWWILGVLCFSLLVIVLDNSILNVAIPTLIVATSTRRTARCSGWSTRTRSCSRVCCSPCGSLGDRYGRRGALQVGLVVFGLGSLASAFASSSDQLIATRAFMGIGGAFIMPATLSIITNVFPPQRAGPGDRRVGRTAGLGVRARPAHRRLPARALLLGLDLPREHPDRRLRSHRRASSSSPRRRTRRRRGSTRSARSSRSSG